MGVIFRRKMLNSRAAFARSVSNSSSDFFPQGHAVGKIDQIEWEELSK